MNRATGWKLTVVVAEDDDALRTLIATRLRDEGMQVIEAPDAFALAKQLALPADVVVADVRMPGMTAPQALQAAAKRPLKLILMSACTDAEVQGWGKLLGASAVLQKPFRLSALLDAIRAPAASGPRAPAARTSDLRF